MKNRLPILMLASCLLLSSYVIILIGDQIPKFFEVAYKATPEEAKMIMPIPTRFASEHAWLFVVGNLLTFIGTVVCLQSKSSKPVKTLVGGLCIQGAIFWMSMFCFFYKAFCGPMSLHHEGSFDVIEFVRFNAGVFPATFLGLLFTISYLKFQKNGGCE